MDPQGKLGDERHHCEAAPSEWVVRFAGLVPSGHTVLDIAAGHGRHSRYFLRLDHPVIAIDRDPLPLRSMQGTRLTVLACNLEAEPWPLPGRQFGGVVVTNYLHRGLLPQLVDSIAPGGALIYETFAQGNEAYGRPRNPDFLLKPGELLDTVRGKLQVVAYEHGIVELPRRSVVQRIAAVCRTDPSPIRAVDPSRANA
jgi:SAM-dependent methyltransferase